MGSKSDKLEHISIGLAVDQHQVGFHVTVPVIFPLANQWVVAEAWRKWLVAREQLEHGYQDRFEIPVPRGCLHLFVIALEGTGMFNGPH